MPIIFLKSSAPAAPSSGKASLFVDSADGVPKYVDDAGTVHTLVGATGATGAAGTNGNTLLSTTGAPSAGTGANGDYAIDTAALLIYGPKASGAWPAGVSIKGNSLKRPSASISSSAGVVTIDLSTATEVYLLTLTENVTSWTFSNPPASGNVAEIRIKLTQGASTAYTCVSPATSGMTAGGAWVVSSTLGAVESLGLAIDSSGNRTLFPSGVYA